MLHISSDYVDIFPKIENGHIYTIEGNPSNCVESEATQLETIKLWDMESLPTNGKLPSESNGLMAAYFYSK